MLGKLRNKLQNSQIKRKPQEKLFVDKPTCDKLDIHVAVTIFGLVLLRLCLPSGLACPAHNLIIVLTD